MLSYFSATWASQGRWVSLAKCMHFYLMNVFGMVIRIVSGVCSPVRQSLSNEPFNVPVIYFVMQIAEIG